MDCKKDMIIIRTVLQKDLPSCGKRLVPDVFHLSQCIDLVVFKKMFCKGN